LTWARYPRSITTPVSDVADQIRNLVRQRRQTGLPDLDEDFLQQASLDELRKVALLASSKSLPTKRQVTLYRARSLAIRLYVLKRANGRCESCGNPGPFRTPDGSLFLEAHHIHKVADGGPDHPRKVIGVCPNCHRRAHYSVDFKKFNDVLARKLAKLEK
jgi:5-methylcytosine-specific restriction protein A